MLNHKRIWEKENFLKFENSEILPCKTIEECVLFLFLLIHVENEKQKYEYLYKMFLLKHVVNFCE